jgi:predicted nucleic acid-binding protein
VTLIVLDTGVLVKAFVEEEGSAKADALLQAAVDGIYRLEAPDFMAIEFGNVLWKYVQRKLLEEEKARQILEQFPFERIEWLPARLLLSDAFRFSIQYAIPVSDGAFLAAAEKLAAQFVTADEGLHRKVRGSLPWVISLREFSVASESERGFPK